MRLHIWYIINWFHLLESRLIRNGIAVLKIKLKIPEPCWSVKSLRFSFIFKPVFKIFLSGFLRRLLFLTFFPHSPDKMLNIHSQIIWIFLSEHCFKYESLSFFFSDEISRKKHIFCRNSLILKFVVLSYISIS